MQSIHDFDRLEQYHADCLDWFVVNWCLGNTCNYACSYCPTSLHDGSEKWHSLTNIKLFVEKVKQLRHDKKIYFEFTGGEVTVNKDFIAICQFCRANDVQVGLISNGSRTIRWWETNKQYFNHVNLSFHAEYADPDHFYKVIETMRGEMAIHINVMMLPERWDDCMAAAKRFATLSDVSISLQPLIHGLADEMYDYTREQRDVFDHQHELFKDIVWHKKFDFYRGVMRATKADGTTSPPISPNDFISKNTNNWQGWECWAGVEQLVVDRDGSIRRGWCGVGGHIGHVGDHDLRLPVAPVVCTKDRCHCNLDIMCSKSRLPGGV